ncbi:Retrovirus-related Pol poly from transposon [Paramuricea clavata]|uniref:Retrovirus-related Pol poly from transposon n=1 Tax=Paramuricea clavata TaxID=317549 RepID=A0A6S7LJJ1_PARCT|nr:Retrovirus-related Pol poly from transposon [Paramuricea clavata]
MVSDNGPQFTSEEFRQFADAYEFQHGTSSPDYPQSNGKSENAVKTAKRIMEKALAVGADPYLGFLDFRNTPTEGLDTSLVQRLFGRRTKTLLPTSSRLLSMRKDDSSTERKLNDRKRKQMFYYNKASKSLKPLKEGDTVFVRPARRSKEWKRATANKAMGIRSYGVTTEQGSKIRRNRRHLRLASNEQSPSNTVSAKDIGAYVDPPRPLITDSNQRDQPDVGETRTTMDNSGPLTTDSNQIDQPDVGETRTEIDDSNDSTRVSQSRNSQSPIRYSSRGRVLRKPVYLKDYV